MSIIIKNSSGGGITLDSSTTANETLALPAGGGAILSDTSTLASSKLSGALPAIDGGSLTGISGISLGTAVATTSGTSIDFTGIPAGVKRITVMFNGVSTNGSSILQVQLGDSGGIENTGYVSNGWTANTNNTSSTTGLLLGGGSGTSYTRNGIAQISLIGSNLYSFSYSGGVSVAGGGEVAGGTKTLSDTLTKVRLTTVNGTDTFDAGSVNISWE